MTTVVNAMNNKCNSANVQYLLSFKIIDTNFFFAFILASSFPSILLPILPSSLSSFLAIN